MMHLVHQWRRKLIQSGGWGGGLSLKIGNISIVNCVRCGMIEEVKHEHVISSRGLTVKGVAREELVSKQDVKLTFRADHHLWLPNLLLWSPLTFVRHHCILHAMLHVHC